MSTSGSDILRARRNVRFKGSSCNGSSYFLLGRLPKVCPSRVRRLTVDIADFGVRPLAGHIEPSKATCRIRPTTNANLMVTSPVFCTGYSANRSATASAHLPPKYPSCRGVTQDFAKSFGGQHGQPKYLSKRTANIAKPTKELNGMSRAMLGMRHSSCRRPKCSCRRPKSFRQRTKAINVRFWPIADILSCTAHVRFRR
jgi:hypothetical protein